MECKIHPRLEFTKFPNMIQRQREALDARIRRLSKSHIVYMGLQHFKTSKRKTQLDVEAIPGKAPPPAVSQVVCTVASSFHSRYSYSNDVNKGIMQDVVVNRTACDHTLRA